MTLPFLPQDEPNPERRAAGLRAAQEIYRYTYGALSPLATLETLPVFEHFDTRYNVLQLETMSRVAANMAAVDVRDDLLPLNTLKDYDSFYPALPKPTSLTSYLHDRSFARQRIAGANPMVLRRVLQEVELEPLALSQNDLQAISGFASAAAAVASGQLFLADYRLFASLVAGTHCGRPKWLAPALALFYWRPAGLRDRGALAPIAIRLTPRSATVTPLHGAAWQAAKAHVQAADANHHEMSTHLGRAHLVMEPFAIATARQLAANHPVRVLLGPHLRFNLARNALARETMLRPDGPVDRLMAGTLESSLKIATEAASSWDFEAFKLPNELKARGVDDASLLPDYPYRDDGLLLWNAIGDFVRDYLSHYYASPRDVTADVELQSWLAELSSEQGGRVKGLPRALVDAEGLAGVLHQIIFTSGPQHSAVNYPQWDFVGAPANMPLAAYAAPEAAPLASASLDESLLPILPPARQVRDQIETMRFLSGWRYDCLGVYPDPQFLDPRALDAIGRFQTALHAAEQRIRSRNTRRSEPYEYLLPSNILNSSSI
jgi:arachidonate 15-lipoxygenase